MVFHFGAPFPHPQERAGQFQVTKFSLNACCFQSAGWSMVTYLSLELEV